MSVYNVIVETPLNTVVSEYKKTDSRSQSYQTEADLEKEFITLLENQGYEYLPIKEEKDLIDNLRVSLEKLNNYKFSESEWTRFFFSSITNKNEGILEKTKKIQSDYIQVLECDDGSHKNIKLIDKNKVHNNLVQVINQYSAEGKAKNRYDVTILVNGLPLVHVELKRRGVKIKEAFNQIQRYQKESFTSGSGLFEYVQIFVISNGTNTKYYSNTTRERSIKEQGQNAKSNKQTSNSFKFTSFWADRENKIISDLIDFTKMFFQKQTLLNILTRYCVLTSENDLLVMRPYQIAATEAILNKIAISSYYKQTGTTDAGGYIWHTTGSGKTLTSFKTALLATEFSDVDKVLFVVDRKDLDYQTMKEYERFQKGAANSNKSTKILQSQLEDNDSRIIITTIQKLSSFIRQNPKHSAYKKHIVMIFDECHRSQFGDMHSAIESKFTNYHLFGFTGTPIFANNAIKGKKNFKTLTTTAVFGSLLHTYTIVDAINDENVLPFRIDYINTIKEKDDIKNKEVQGINSEEVLLSKERISAVVSYILEHFDQKTLRSSTYNLKGKRVNGFNSILATSSIDAAKLYYKEFKKQLSESHRNLNIATIFSFTENEEQSDEVYGVIDDEDLDVASLDSTSKEFLRSAIDDYNKTFNTNYSINGDSFENYYKDISKRVKEREIDLLIVVNMFLTGFDATTLNTLWVDKNLKQHGLIQAFSRTNRILNSVKVFGNIVCFRNLENEVNEAIALFGDREATSVVLLKSFDDYYNGYDDEKGHHVGYKDRVETLVTVYPLGERIEGEKAKKDFIKQMGRILRLRNILSAFDEFKGQEILSERDFQDYISMYNDLYEEFTKGESDKESIKEDVEFELELVKQVEVNIDYILELVREYHKSNCKNKEILISIDKAVTSSPDLRSKKELIDEFVENINVELDVDKDWVSFVNEKKKTELKTIIKEENLNEKETYKFVENAFRDGEVKTYGTDVDSILPPMSRFGTGSKRSEKKHTILSKLQNFFTKFFGLVS